MAPSLEDPPARGEVSLVGVPTFKLTACQEPEQWEPEMYDKEGIEQANEVIILIAQEAGYDLNFSKWRTGRQGMSALLPLPMDKR